MDLSIISAEKAFALERTADVDGHTMVTRVDSLLSRVAGEDRLAFTLALVLTSLIVTSILFVRALFVQYPVVLSDEALYSLHAKFLNNPHFAPTMPNILYFYLYHPTAWFGVNHAVVAKIFNAGFFGLALFPLYATARQFLSSIAAYMFSVLVVCSPISSYSVYIMPESMYFFIFWVLVYIVVARLPNDAMWGAAYAGLALAALSATKPHGLILIATVPLVLVGLHFQRPDQSSVSRLIRANLGYLTAFVVGRLILNYLAVGAFLISPLGNYYEELFTPAMRPKRALLSSALWFSIRGHLSYLAILFWPAVAFIIWPSELPARRARENPHYVALLGFSFSTLLLLILMAAKYTVDVHGAVAPKQICRLHGRYYDFALGTLVLLFLAKTNSAHRTQKWPKLFRCILGGGTIVAATAAYFAFLDYCPNFVDFPEVVCFSMFPIGLALVISGSIGSAACFAFAAPATARRVYLTLLVGLAFTTSAAIFVGQILFVWPAPKPDLAAIAVRNLVPAEIDDGIVLARTEDARTYRALFQLDSLSERRIVNQPVLTSGDIPPGKKWALLLDPYRLDLPYTSTVQGNRFQFVQLAPAEGIATTAGAETESAQPPH